MQKLKPILLIALCILCAASIGTTIFLLVTTSTPADEPPKSSFTPPPFDESAVTGFPEVPEGLGFSPLPIEQGFQVHLCGNLKYQDGKIPVYFTSPETNTVLLKLQLNSESGETLAETGIIKPGQYVKDFVLANTPDDGQTVTMKIIAYEPETYISMGTAGLNTTINK